MSETEIVEKVLTYVPTDWETGNRCTLTRDVTWYRACRIVVRAGTGGEVKAVSSVQRGNVFHPLLQVLFDGQSESLPVEPYQVDEVSALTTAA